MTDFESMLRRLGRRERLASLIRALRLEPRLERLSLDPAAVSGAAEFVRTAFVVGERGSMRVLLLEVKGEPASSRIAGLARSIRARDLSRQHLFIAAGTGYRRILLGCFGLEAELRHLTIERTRVRRTDVEAFEEMVAAEGEGGLALSVRYARALDRSRVTRQFFQDFGCQRALVAAAWKGLALDAFVEREQLALLFLCRCMFLYFLQRRGHLAGDPAYIANLWIRWNRDRLDGGGQARHAEGTRRADTTRSTDEAARPSGGGRAGGTFFRAVFEPLFFGALNRRPADRDGPALALGELPYLNGGLFERHALERAAPRLDLPDAIVGGVIEGLFERYRFTTRDAAEELVDGATDAGVDPEMLGKVFEGMMAAGRRGDTGTYYTPAPVVDRLVDRALACYVAGRTGVATETAERLAACDETAGLDAAQRAAIARAIRDVRVLDPACGSGAFLLGALSRLTRLRSGLQRGDDDLDLRREIVGRSLHGVDLQGDAALLCALRLWLALAIDADRDHGEVPPLPNLDRRIRQGDALLDPLDLDQITGTRAAAGPDHGAVRDARVRRALRALAPAGARYLTAEPAEKDRLKRRLARGERSLAAAWLTALDERLGWRIAELRSHAASRDLFDHEVAGAAAARNAIPPLEARRAELAALAGGLNQNGSLPFFSFRVHFADAADGFDLILSNPPWVRAHRWPASVGRLMRRRYAVCREPGWRYGAMLAGAPVAAGAQVDLSQLFLERSLALLVPGGVLAMLLPAKTFRSLYGGPARRMLLLETRIASIEDHSLDQRSVFQADAFAGAVIARKIDAPHSIPDAASANAATKAVGSKSGRRTSSDEADGSCVSQSSRGLNAPVQVTMLRRSAEPLRFNLPQDELPLFRYDATAPWLIAPEPVRRALRRMQAAGPPLGTTGLRVRRGVITGANEALIVREAKPRLGGLCRIRAEGWFRTARQTSPARSARAGKSSASPVSTYEAIVETTALRPLLRGSDIEAWNYRVRSHVIWIHADDGTASAAPPRLRRYLARHDAVLRARSSLPPGAPVGSLFRVSTAALGNKVAWHDLAETLHAVALPAALRSSLGETQPIIPLNTVYYVPTAGGDDAFLLAAYLNAGPVRTFARAIAERAKDARFRFFAWTVAALPLPAHWQQGKGALRMIELSRRAHVEGGITGDAASELDALVSRAYGLGEDDVAALATFDSWLTGVA